MALGLERVLAVKGALGAAPDAPVITVGGTNGKGSTCALIERMLRCAGYRTGLYTSPHLLAFNERVRIDGEAADDAALCRAFARVEAARGGIPLTYFEFATLAAWQAFASAGVEALIFEVGLGGRLDAVNAFDTDCAVVASIDFDHMEFLGVTRESIGREKAGIFRAGKPAIVGDARPPASVIEHAAAVGADLQLIGRDYGYEGGQGQWTYWGRRGRRAGLAHPALRGAVQLANASTAIAALEVMAQRLPVTAQDIRRGLAEVEVAGRFQVLPGLPLTILDVAHNPQAVAVMVENLAVMPFHGRTFAVFGMLADKDVAGVVERARGAIDRWLVAGLPGPRGMTAEALGALLARLGIASVDRFDSPAEAWRSAAGQAKENDRIIIFGSFLTVADVLKAMNDGRKRPAA